MSLLGALLLSTTSTVTSPLGSWLSTRAVGIGSRVVVEGDRLVATKAAQRGDTLLELRADACLTAAAAYADREMGRDLQLIAARVGPGFETVALAAYLAAERVRGFNAESWYAGSAAEQVGSDGLQRASTWSPLTSAHWQAEMLRPSTIDAELVPLVTQGFDLVYPIVELAARRAWVPGAAPAPPMFSDAWVRAATTDDSEGWTTAELSETLTQAFGLVLAHQWPEPPPFFSDGGGPELTSEAAPRWGYADASPVGPALLPPLDGLFVARSDEGADDSSKEKDAGNTAVGVPQAPEAGSLGDGVCVRCVATRAVEAGETLLVAGPSRPAHAPSQGLLSLTRLQWNPKNVT